ncbi:E2 ubiquitin-conjugating enzyme [Malassezia vespertilionis]|nr:E2 ubiquitin-conjugating enzyme [Malassezia vespertilionis]WFD08363.1 E2 ubiquitin-conjugating enzyme [Malassezia vespertilionis]
MRGPSKTPYEGGEYWGQLLFPSDYPFKPPGIKVQTPNGRFEPDARICTSMSDFHPGSWNPAWSVSSILVGLTSFMCTDELTTGSIIMPSRDRRVLAAKSHAFNRSQRRFAQLFPEYASEVVRDVPNMSLPAQGKNATLPSRKSARALDALAPSASAASRDASDVKKEANGVGMRSVVIGVSVVLAGLFAAKTVERLAA